MYRIWLAESGSLKQLVEDGYHFQVTATSLTKCWGKAYSTIIRKKGVYVSTIARSVKASFITADPREIGETRDRKYRLYIQRF